MLLRYTGPPYEVPPNGINYRFVEDGFRVHASDWVTFYEEILRHYRDNDYSIPENWKELAMDQACRFFPPGWAMYEDGAVPRGFIDLRFSLEDLMHGTRVMVDWTLKGRNVVSQEEADQRAETCSRCFANLDITGCVSCYNLVGMIMDVTGQRQTNAEAALKSSCGVCKCSAKAQVWVPVESLEKGVTEEMMEQFERIPWCWKASAIREYRLNGQ